jgi:SAM-dependent methyltransferase
MRMPVFLATPGADHARVAYDTLAESYDLVTQHHDYDRWIADVEELAHRHGLTGTRLLDVACGTGKSLLPFLDRGYDVTACDLSPAMLRKAAAKVGRDVRLEVHDMRALPQLGSFDLITCLDDAINYLMSGDELVATFAGMRENLGPGGLLVFDTNTLRTYRTFFSSLTVVPSPTRVAIWHGMAETSLGAGDRASSTLDIFACGDDGRWRRSVSVHHQRHHGRRSIETALRRAGLDPVAVYGVAPEGAMTNGVSEDRNNKIVYIARPRAAQGEGR